jgi:hypothetical protein
MVPVDFVLALLILIENMSAEGLLVKSLVRVLIGVSIGELSHVCLEKRHLIDAISINQTCKLEGAIIWAGHSLLFKFLQIMCNPAFAHPFTAA